MDDFRGANRRFEIGLGAFERRLRRDTAFSVNRDGVGVTIVTSRRRRPKAPVIPRMLGTIPPSRTGSSPLHRCNQPLRLAGGWRLLGSVAWFSSTRVRFEAVVVVMDSSHFHGLRARAALAARWSTGERKCLQGTLSEPIGAPLRDRLRRPRAHCATISVREGCHPGQFFREGVHVEWIESTAGRAVGLWYQCRCATGARRNQEGQTARGGLIDDEAPGFGKAWEYEGTGVRVPAAAVHRTEESRGGELPSPQPLCAIACSISEREWSVAAEDEVPGGLGVALSAIGGKRFDQADQVLLRDEPAHGQKIRLRR